MQTPIDPTRSFDVDIHDDDLLVLRQVEQRVLWLTTYLLHYVNKLRPSPDDLKVGGHQASSASLVSLLTTLYGVVLRPDDHVAIKPHAAPVFHVLQYLLGYLPLDTLRTLRDLGGLQAYPNRTKDPDSVTMSTASAGLGVAATIFGALTQRYLADHFGRHSRGRYIAIVGDAELDEGNVPEALGWLGNLLHAPVRALGVTAFGESVALPDLYHRHYIDADAVLGAMAQLLFAP